MPASDTTSSEPLQIDLRQAIYALADALDLVGIDEVGHGKRVGFMAYECGRSLNLSDPSRVKLFHAALLHDCGVSSTRVHQHLVEEMEWDNAEIHCHIGHDLLNSFHALSSLAPVVRYHHTRWEKLASRELNEEDKLFANLIFLVDRVDALMAPHYGKDMLLATATVRERIQESRNTLFAPELVDTFLHVSSAEAFWFSLESPHLERYLFEMEHQHTPQPIQFSELKQLALIFAHIVDAKSHFTHEHSQGVASLARYLAEQQELEAIQCEKIELAGLLHDLGKLKIPDEILEKPGALTELDRSIMLRHSFESYQILRRIDGLEEVAIWAAYHHEIPNGHGYPFHAASKELSKEARIIAVADVFQALAQKRPYRDALTPEEILSILENLVGSGRLDEELVGYVREDLEQCWQRAVLANESS